MRDLFNSSLRSISLAAIILGGAATVLSTGPANDNLVEAETISGASGNIVRTNAAATRESAEPAHITFITRGMTVFRTVWFKWTPTESKPTVFEVMSTENGFDASMAIYKGSAYPLPGVATNNDTYGNRPRIEFTPDAGVTYTIAVGTFNSSNQSGEFNLVWNQTDGPSNNMFANALPLEGEQGAVAVTNVNATSQPEEQYIGNGNTIWFKYVNSTSADHSVTLTTRHRFSNITHNTLCAYTGDLVSELSRVVCNKYLPASTASRITFLAKAGQTYRIDVDSLHSGSPLGNLMLTWHRTKPEYYTDFAMNGDTVKEVYYDEAADITLYRPSNGTWHSLGTANFTYSQNQFGLDGDKPVPADYDGDGFADLAVVRNDGSFLTWYIRNSYDNRDIVQQWGLAGDKPVPGDYDKDGRMDIAVFRPSDGTWYVCRSSDSQLFSMQWGLQGDIPVRGDFTGTLPGTDLAVFRPSTGTWYVNDMTKTYSLQFGLPGDIPVAADYDNDGWSDLAVFRPSNGNWYRLRSADGLIEVVSWGLAGDIPQTGDFDANSNDLDDFTVFRPSDNTWYILRSEQTRVAIIPFGAPGDIPVTSITY